MDTKCLMGIFVYTFLVNFCWLEMAHSLIVSFLGYLLFYLQGYPNIEGKRYRQIQRISYVNSHGRT